MRFNTNHIEKFENSDKVIRIQYCDEKKLLAMRRFHKNVIIKGITPYDKTYEFISQFRNIDVLDLGCGSGSFWESKEDFSFIKSLTLIDQSKTLVDRARSIVESKNILNVSWKVSDINKDNNFIYKKFDIIIIHQVYHHLKDPLKVHLSLFNNIKENGYILITTCLASHMKELYQQVAIFFDVDYDTARGLSHFNEEHLKKFPKMYTSEVITNSIYSDSVSLFVDYVHALAIQERFEIDNFNEDNNFNTYIKNWANSEISSKGCIEFSQAILFALFQ